MQNIIIEGVIMIPHRIKKMGPSEAHKLPLFNFSELYCAKIAENFQLDGRIHKY